MALDPDIQAMLRASLPKAVAAAVELATKPKSAPTNILKAADLVLRVAASPDRYGPENSNTAKAALPKVRRRLEQIRKTSASPRIMAKAAKQQAMIDRLLIDVAGIVKM